MTFIVVYGLVVVAYVVFMVAVSIIGTWYWGGWQLWERRPRHPRPPPIPVPLDGGTYRTLPREELLKKHGT